MPRSAARRAAPKTPPFCPGTLKSANLRYRQRVITAIGAGNILRWWNCDDASGVAADISENGGNATLSGTVSYGQSAPVDGLALQITNGRLTPDTAFKAAFRGDAGFISLWLQVPLAIWDDTTQYQWFNLGADPTNNYAVVRKNPDKSMSWLFVAGGTVANVLTSGYFTDKYVHYLFAWDKPNNRLNAWVNGTPQIQTTGIGTWAGSIVDSQNSIGNKGTVNGTTNWTIKLDEVIVGTIHPTNDQARVLANAPTGQIIIDGDSRSIPSVTWHGRAAGTLSAVGELGLHGFGIASRATLGYSVAGMITRAAATIDSLLIPGANNVLLVWGGVNDAPSTPNANTIYTRLQTYCQARRAAGWNKIAVCTEIDAQSTALNAVDWHGTIYPALNTLLRNDHSFADALIDLGADARLQNALDTTYFNADKVHPIDAGHAVIGSIAAPVLASLV